MKYRCIRCGYDKNGIWNFRGYYACKAPLCRVENVVFCASCLEELQKQTGAKSSKCPTCKVGEIRALSYGD